MTKWFCYADGSSLGNPGHSSAGVVIVCDDRIINRSKYLGSYLTNNEAEYGSLLFAIELLKEHNTQYNDVVIRMDSSLVVNQVAGRWRVKAQHIKPLVKKAQKGIATANFSITLELIKREMNSAADNLAQSKSREMENA